ncbi:MAG: N-6 DNA methylase [Lactobacillales bacterium]|jgi:type I restriction enzyme M protein|nr:N-6 DNA methylase [Lactobacillales bacterium]
MEKGIMYEITKKFRGQAELQQVQLLVAGYGVTRAKSTSELITTLKELNDSLIDIRLFDFAQKIDAGAYEVIVEAFKNEQSGLIVDIVDTIGEYGGRRFADHVDSPAINELLYALGDLKEGDSVLDPTAGEGSALQTILSEEITDNFSLQDINPSNVALLRMKAILLKKENIKIYKGDVLDTPAYKNEKFDKVITVPPMGTTIRSSSFFDNDKYNRFMFGMPPHNTPELAFVCNGIAALNETGKAIFLIPNGLLFKGSIVAEIRRGMLANEWVEAIIELPEGSLLSTNRGSSILIINKNKKEKDIFMVNASEFKVERRSMEFENELKDHFEKILFAYAERNEIDGFSKFVKVEDLEDAVILPSRYVFSNEIELGDYGVVEVKFAEMPEKLTERLDEVTDLHRGLNYSTSDENDEGAYRIIKISDIIDNELDTKLLKKVKARENSRIENYKVRKGDVLLSVRGTTNKICIIKEDYENVIFNSNLICIRPYPSRTDSEWLFEYLKSPIGLAQLEQMSEGGTIKQISPNNLRSLKLPKIGLRDQILSVENYNNKKDKLNKKIQELKQREKELDQQLFQDMNISDLFEIK